MLALMTDESAMQSASILMNEVVAVPGQFAMSWSVGQVKQYVPTRVVLPSQERLARSRSSSEKSKKIGSSSGWLESDLLMVPTQIYPQC
jgi:hypothetical protein